MKSSFMHLDQLMIESNIDTIRFLCTSIKEDMGDSLLSEWFALLVRAVFLYTHRGAKEFNMLLSAIRRVNKTSEAGLTQLRDVGLAQHAQLFLELGELQQKQKHLMSASFYPTSDGKSILDRDTELNDQIVALEKQTNPTLALFLIVEKIIKFLQGHKAVSKELKTSVKEEISQDPLEFIVKLIPVLTLLQKAEENDLGEIIRLVLQLINIKDARLAASVQKELFKKGWLKITTREAPKIEGEPEEEEQTPCCFSGLAHAASQLFFKRRRRNRVLPEIEKQEVNTGDMDDISFSESPVPEDKDHSPVSYFDNVSKPLSREWQGKVEILEVIDEGEELAKEQLKMK